VATVIFICNALRNILAGRFALVAQKHVNVGDIADTAFVSLDEDTLVAEGAKALYSQERCSIVVTRLDRSTGQRVPVGIITERDIIFRIVAQNRGPFKVMLKDIMSSPLITIDADKSVEEAMAILKKHKINRLPVVNDGSMIGIVTTEIIMHMVSDEKHES
jgi:CBS domain-containing protein